MRAIPLLLAMALLCALSAPAAGAPRAADFSVRLGDAGPTGARAASADGHGKASWTSRVIRPKRPVHVLGLRWRSAPEHLHGQVRVRTAAGRWRRWTEIPHAHSAHGSDPVWAGGATAVQLRLAGRVRGLKLHFVNVGGVRTPARRVRARAAAAMPPIVPRDQWGAAECAPRDAPTPGEVKLGFVHHTVNANEYRPEDSAAMVLGICRFHRNTNGWDDIGYNFLVDKYGTIFEGRAGGVDQAIVGAQAQGFNAVSTGVANLGTYEDVPQSPQAIESMAKLLAWKLPLHGAPVTGTVTVPSAGGSSNRHPKGRQVTFERISGHRDGNETACPGAQLYAQLPGLRQRADRLAPDVVGPPAGGQPAAAAPARLSLQAARLALSFPEPVRLTGRVTDAAGTGVAGSRVRLQVLTAKGFRSVASTVSGPDGGWAAELPTSRNRAVRAIVGRIVSNTVKVTVAPVLTVPAPARRLQAGRRAVLRGEVRPRKAAIVVEAARQLTPTRYAKAIVVRGRASGGRFRVPVTLARPGLYRLRVRFAGDRRNAPAQVDHFVRAVRSLRSSGAAPGAAPAPSSSGGAAPEAR
jgi:hypothetical protein